MNDNLDRLLDAIEHPERYSTAELEQLLADDETRALYNLMTRTSAALTEPARPDVDAEWGAFVAGNMARRSLWSRLSSHSRVAAIAAIFIVSLAVVAATIVLNKSDDFKYKSTETEQLSSESTLNGTGEAPTEADVATQPEVVVFNGDQLETIIYSICEFYGASAAIHNPAAKTLRLHFRWNQADSIAEVADQLNNFEQIHIVFADNTLTVE